MKGMAAMSQESIARVQALEAAIIDMPQTAIETHHVLHGGQYVRTIFIPATVTIVGALIRVPTTLMISGDCTVYLGDEPVRVTGYAVLAASAGRKTAFYAHAPTYLTMSFATSAETIEEAEDEFTADAERLLSRSGRGTNTIVITGE